MKEEAMFSEKQRMRNISVILILILINMLFIIGIIKQIGFGTPFGNNPLSDTFLLILTGIILIFTFVNIFIVSLDTIINKEGIYVRFAPFQRRYNYYSWEDIDEVSIITYRPLKTYGGWGIRFGMNSKIYNMSGNIALKIRFKNRKDLLIGTINPDELSNTLIKLGKLNKQFNGKGK